MSLLKPEISIGVALATGAIVGGIYFNALPPVADVRVAPQQNRDISSARKAAAWTSAGVTAAISLIAKDPTVFAVGAGMTILMDLWYRHANAVDPRTGKAGTVAALLGSTVAVEPAVGSAEFTDEAEFVY